MISDPLGDSASPPQSLKIPASSYVDYYRGKINEENSRVWNRSDKVYDYIDQWAKYLSVQRKQDDEIAYYDEWRKDRKPFVPFTQNSAPGSFNLGDAENGLRYVYDKYGKEIAIKVEVIYRLETRNFRSGQYAHTGTAGMQTNGNPPPYYGWSSRFYTDLPTGTWSAFENKGLSGVGGNAQNKKTPQEFVVMPSVTAAMSFLANFITGHDGNAGRWFSTLKPQQDLYNKTIKNSNPAIISKIENDQ
ncbi:MAG: hypothetical protein JST42_03880 [Bacteroidetes bacterium]|nr:hypothetical protein [Bacteroidota bacterium]